MQLQLCVITDIDPEIARVHLRVTGVLTEANHQLLYQVIQRSRSLPDNTGVLVDLTTAERIDNTPVELCRGVEIDDVAVTVLRGRATWAATCRPLAGVGEDRVDGYVPRCGCCPLLDSPVARIYENGSEDPTPAGRSLATVYRVHLDVDTGILMDLTPLDGTEGVSLTSDIRDVDEPFDPLR